MLARLATEGRQIFRQNPQYFQHLDSPDNNPSIPWEFNDANKEKLERVQLRIADQKMKPQDAGYYDGQNLSNGNAISGGRIEEFVAKFMSAYQKQI
ncbi:hypothetical protein PVL29_002268 [Vitis rotundifolia]|uniref:Uncharacterized protein n=1 Tax=Vitis rotundifolia TaxID=103349 RepID=A0AA39AHA4_VITRO|nr:hypothetical protein PVL29_002268 [Vitis rotundifolia]